MNNPTPVPSDQQSSDLYYMQVTGHCGNSLLWWRSGKHGYTLDIQKAHVWTRDEAMRQHKSRPTEDFPWRKDYIDARLQHHVHCEVVDAQEGRAV